MTQLFLAGTFCACLAVVSAPVQQANSAPTPELPTCVILDHDNNGLDLTTPVDGVDFDLDGDGVKERVGWTRSGGKDGFLAIDMNKNGAIDNGTELLGTGFKHPKLAKTTSGLGALLFLQDDVTMGSDGQPKIVGSAQLNASDPVFQEFRLWFDTNHNGRSESDELSTLQQAAIKEMSVAYRRAPDSGTYSLGVILGNPNGNSVRLYGRYTIDASGQTAARTAFEIRLLRK